MSTSSIKKVNLEQIQRPKTLVVIHYKGKRVSIPLFESIDNITEYLWHQLVKFQKTVLQKQQKSKQPRNSYTINDILCFTAYDQDKNRIDIKMNILLSMCRLSKDHGKSKTDIKELDITSYYKYLQIQPYYGFTSKQLIPQYQLFSVLKVGSYFTVYLGRKISEGRFYSVKVCRNDSRISQNQYSSMRSIHAEQLEFDNKDQLGLIPRIEQVRKADGLFIYIYEYCPGGSLRNALQKNISEMQCLHYMKQLVWGIHTLHHKFNLIYRALCFENISVDFVGNLRLDNFAYCQPCFANYLSQSNVAESYDQKYEIPNVQIPPEVQRSSKYNNLVDYYGIGAVLQEMFGQTNNYKYSTKKQKEGIEIAFENFMAENIKDRQLFVNEIISELHQEKIKAYSGSTSKRSQTMQHQRLAFNKISTGQSINIEQKTINGIMHEEVLKILKPSHDDQFYYLNPVKKSRKNSKNKSKSKSKSKSKEKGNQDKNVKPLNATGMQQRIKTKNKKNGSDKLLNKNGSDKSLNKSIDSRNNSAKSEKLKVSQEKIKGKQKPPKNIGSTNINKQGLKSIIPKSPKNVGSIIKSPNKNVFNQTMGYNNSPKSPPKLFSNKSKNKL